MKRASFSLAAAALLAGLGATVVPSSPGARAIAESTYRSVNVPDRSTPAPGPAVVSPERAAWLRTRSTTFVGLGGYTRHPRWTNASYQRAARKRRNQQRNRRAHRG